MWVQCCVCKKVRRGSKWGRIEIPVEDRHQVSHGYCPACANLAFKQAEAERNKTQSLGVRA